jgi:hypothetical protein
MNRPKRPEARSSNAVAALILVVIGLALIAQDISSLAFGVELILAQFMAAARVVSVSAAAALIVAGLVLIGREQ